MIKRKIKQKGGKAMKKDLLFRFNEKTGEWKKLTVEVNGEKTILTISQGQKGQKETKQISIALTEPELLYLAEFLTASARLNIYNDIRKKGD